LHRHRNQIASISGGFDERRRLGFSRRGAALTGGRHATTMRHLNRRKVVALSAPLPANTQASDPHTTSGVSPAEFDDQEPDMADAEPDLLPAAALPAPSVRGARETIVMIGNCFAGMVCRQFNRHHPFAERIDLSVLQIHLTKDITPEIEANLRQASRVVLQDISNVERLNVADFVPSGCEIIKFPQLVLPALWPFLATFFRPDPQFRKLDKNGFREPDGMIAVLRKTHPGIEERVRAYRELDEQKLSRVDALLDMQTRRLEASDAALGCTLGALLRDNFRKRPYFYNPLHPTGETYQLVGDFIWQRLGMSGDCPRFQNADAWRNRRIPVHPTVARRIGVEWAREDTSYSYGALGEVTWEQYVRAYIGLFG
jgi:hypothetical protein